MTRRHAGWILAAALLLVPAAAPAQPLAETIARPATLEYGVLYLSATAEQPTVPTFPLGTPLVGLWDPPLNPTEANSGVDNYRWRMDADTTTQNTGVTVGQASYRFTLPQARLTVGPHTFHVAACRGAVCGPELSVAFAIEFPLPGIPRNGGIGTGTVAVLGLPEAVDVAQAYARIAIRRSLTPEELGWLAQRHPPVPPTRESVLHLMDGAYAELVQR